MGTPYHPIPFDILARMPPDVRAATILQERERARRLTASNGRVAGIGLGIIAAILALVLGLAFKGMR